MKTACELCFHRCLLGEGQIGLCRARANHNGKIVSLNYGKLTSIALDPIEKKPLRRFRPGSMILSVGSFGCNLRCPFCQNHEISMAGSEDIPSAEISPEMLVKKAAELKRYGNIGLAYTYNEPLVGYEYVKDCAELIKKRGMVNVLVTNGTINERPLKALLPLIDAANIDLKAFTKEGYEKLGGDFESVKRTIALAAESGCHTEITTLIVPGLNDSEAEITSAARFIASVDKNIPLHLSRFFPQYHLTDRAATSVPFIYRLAETARKYLNYVYTGNC